jgi:hypothetical protein
MPNKRASAQLMHHTHMSGTGSSAPNILTPTARKDLMPASPPHLLPARRPGLVTATARSPQLTGAQSTPPPSSRLPASTPRWCRACLVPRPAAAAEAGPRPLALPRLPVPPASGVASASTSSAAAEGPASSDEMPVTSSSSSSLARTLTRSEKASLTRRLSAAISWSSLQAEERGGPL